MTQQSGAIFNRMDRNDMEPDNGLHEGFEWMQVLLCGNHVQEASGHGR